jgi:hypothetical protein
MVIEKIILSCSLFLFVITINTCNTIEPDDNNGNGQDTTSHNFTFETFTFGEHSSSTLYDVAILNDSSIWAVGEIYMNDSLGQPDPHPYGLIHWDGFKWEVKRITAQNPSGGYSYITPTGIIAISTSEIWLASGGVFLFDGQNITRAFWLVNYSGYSGGIFNNGETAQRLWGKSSSDLYTVGNKGAIAFYNGSIWQKIESGTGLNIYDIFGQKTNTGDYEILCVASDIFLNQGKKIIQIKNNNVNSVLDQGLSNSLHTIWFVPGKKYFTGGDGLFSTISLNENWLRHTDLPSIYKNAVRGNDINDIVVVGAFGLLLHYNGKAWMNFQETPYINGTLGRVDIKENIVCSVGSEDNKAVIIIGRRE